jgi:hypothetical protein
MLHTDEVMELMRLTWTIGNDAAFCSHAEIGTRLKIRAGPPCAWGSTTSWITPLESTASSVKMRCAVFAKMVILCIVPLDGSGGLCASIATEVSIQALGMVPTGQRVQKEQPRELNDSQ